MLTRIFRRLTTTALVAASMVAVAPSASAAPLTQVTNFGTNPSNLQMYEYVPNTVKPRPAVLVALHYCTGTGPAFYTNTEFARVYATGHSSGAMMTNVLLGDYPDVFKTGAAFAGVPFGCFATTNGSEWNTECALRYPNFGEEIKQWTNVTGVSVQGGPHNVLVNGMAQDAIDFLGLSR